MEVNMKSFSYTSRDPFWDPFVAYFAFFVFILFGFILITFFMKKNLSIKVYVWLIGLNFFSLGFLTGLEVAAPFFTRVFSNINWTNSILDIIFFTPHSYILILSITNIVLVVIMKRRSMRIS